MKKQLFSLLMLGSLVVSASIVCAEHTTTATQPEKINCFRVMEKLIMVKKLVSQQPLTIKQYETIIDNLQSVIPVLKAHQEDTVVQIILRHYPLEASEQLLAETNILLAELLKPTPTTADAAPAEESTQPAAPADAAPVESVQPPTVRSTKATKGLPSVLSTTGYVATRPVVWTAKTLGTVVDYTTPVGDVARTVFHPIRTSHAVRESSKGTIAKKALAVVAKTALTAGAVAMFAKDWFASE